jgi:outer membrane receptor protein involved in Fe transport
MTCSRQRKLQQPAAKRTRTALGGIPLASAISALLAGHGAMAQNATESGVLENVIVTAQKRQENLQEVPLSIQALGTGKLQELHIQSFDDYVKFLPSVSFTTLGPGFGVAYMRGVASGENNNHSGPQPTVGMYLDEQPITTIQGSLDIHLYDIARVEALAGPQGTLYGASSMAGTIRIITNKPDAEAFDAGYDVELNSVKNGEPGYVAEGFVNIPINENAAIRLVGWYEKESGFIDNVARTRTFATSGGCIVNSLNAPAGCASTPSLADDKYNDVETYGARAALKIDLNDSWSVTPSVMGQDQKANGVPAFDPKVGDLKIARYYPEGTTDRWIQAALTVEGKIGDLDLVYAGAYLKRDDTVDADYSDYAYFYDAQKGYGTYWTDDLGQPLADPSQYIRGTDGYKRYSNELRVASPQDKRLRFVAGVFMQRQEHDIFQNYRINGLADALSVTGWPDTIWLTQQQRTDKDSALFGELSFDLTQSLTVTAGLRAFKAENSLLGFFGFTPGYSTNYGESLCFSSRQLRGAPCTNLDDDVDESGTVPKVNLTWRIDDERMVYATYSEGFRPGGINRNSTVPPYKSDRLANYEVGWKTTWADKRLRFNGAVFVEDWDDIQFSFLPPSGAGLTVIKNAGGAKIKGLEMDLALAATESLTLSGGLSLLDTELTQDYIPEAGFHASKGDQLPISPKFKSNLTARYAFNVGELESYVQGAAVYQGSSWSDLLSENRALIGKQDSYAIADLSAGFRKEAYTFELYLNNAFDERAQLYKFSNCAHDVCGVNPYTFTNRPRTIGVKFGQEF